LASSLFVIPIPEGIPSAAGLPLAGKSLFRQRTMVKEGLFGLIDDKNRYFN
jgi:hypothetical protein